MLPPDPSCSASRSQVPFLFLGADATTNGPGSAGELRVWLRRHTRDMRAVSRSSVRHPRLVIVRGVESAML